MANGSPSVWTLKMPEPFPEEQGFTTALLCEFLGPTFKSSRQCLSTGCLVLQITWKVQYIYRIYFKNVLLMVLKNLFRTKSKQKVSLGKLIWNPTCFQNIRLSLFEHKCLTINSILKNKNKPICNKKIL